MRRPDRAHGARRATRAPATRSCRPAVPSVPPPFSSTSPCRAGTSKRCARRDGLHGMDAPVEVERLVPRVLEAIRDREDGRAALDSQSPHPARGRDGRDDGERELDRGRAGLDDLVGGGLRPQLAHVRQLVAVAVRRRRAAGKGLIPAARPVVVEIGVQVGAVRLHARRLPEQVVVARLVDQAEDVAAQLGQDVDRDVLVLETDAAQAAVAPGVVDAAGHVSSTSRGGRRRRRAAARS